MATPIQRTHQIHINRMNIGNHLFAYFFAKQLAKSLPGTTYIHFSGIPELGIMPLGLHGQVTIFNSTAEKTLHYRVSSHQPDVADIITEAHRNDLTIHINWPVCRLPLIISVDEAKKEVVGHAASIEAAKDICRDIATDHLMVHVRAGDILRNVHRDYAPTPVQYIRRAQLISGLPLAFFGQTSPSWYVSKLRSSFPHAKFINEQPPSIDFEIARQSQYILISASTFAWTATWTSSNAKKIYIPLHGFLDPNRRPDQDLQIEDDPRRILIREDIPDSEWYPSQAQTERGDYS